MNVLYDDNEFITFQIDLDNIIDDIKEDIITLNYEIKELKIYTDGMSYNNLNNRVVNNSSNIEKLKERIKELEKRVLNNE